MGRYIKKSGRTWSGTYLRIQSVIEEGTPFYEKYGEGERAEARRRRELPDEDTERMMYQFTKNILWSYGYHRYEISNYAKEGMNAGITLDTGTAQNIWESEPVRHLLSITNDS